MLIHAGSRPAIPSAIAPPMNDPRRPIAIVSQIGIGSGPGSASRASAPVMNPVTMTEITAPAMWRRVPRLHDPDMSLPAAPFVLSLRIRPRRMQEEPDYTDEIPSLRELGRIALHPQVTFLIGENGSGKSTLVEALAVASKLNPEGGGRTYQFAFSTRSSHSSLHRRLELERASIAPLNGFFLRAESVF